MEEITNYKSQKRIMKTILLIIGLYYAFTFVSIGQEFPHDDDPSVVGKTFTVEEDDEEITFDFRENGVVFISGSEFEDGTFGEWRVKGDAFGTVPATGSLPNQGKVKGYMGKERGTRK
jgi:hypothetical protein